MKAGPCFLAVLLYAHAALAQHQVPVGSADNRIALTISNSSHLPLPYLNVRINSHPLWITPSVYQAALPMLKGNSDHGVSFSFGVAPAVPVGENGAILIEISSAWGTRWTKQIDLVTVAPVSACLHQNYPNPFNPATVITYQVPTASRVSLKVFNLLGQVVATLVDKDHSAGEHRVSWDAGGIPSGVYVYELRTMTMTLRRSMLLLK